MNEQAFQKRLQELLTNLRGDYAKIKGRLEAEYEKEPAKRRGRLIKDDLQRLSFLSGEIAKLASSVEGGKKSGIRKNGNLIFLPGTF